MMASNRLRYSLKRELGWIKLLQYWWKHVEKHDLLTRKCIKKPKPNHRTAVGDFNDIL